MGEIIPLNKEYIPQKKKKIFKKINIIVGFLAGVATIVTAVITLVSMKFNRDWQAIAEKYNNEGLELYNAGNYEEAIELYTKAIKLEDKGIEDIDMCYFNRGMAYYKLGEYERAIAEFTQAININTRAKYYFSRAAAYEKIGEDVKAGLDNVSGLSSTIQ